jgi:hypothetical protein
MESRPAIAFIDRWYDDGFDGHQPWPRRRRWTADDPYWEGYSEVDDETARFDSVGDAIEWGRAHAKIVFVRLGSADDSFYSAGVVRAYEHLDGSGRAYPDWPPDNWPDYRGPDQETRRF